MAAPTLLKNPTQVKTGPGQIFVATPGTAVPTFAATASKFSNAWAGWRQIGYTDEGMTFAVGRTVEDITVAEELEPIRKVTTGRTARVSFAASGVNENNIKIAMNGGTWEDVGVGSGATLVRKYSPPELGEEVRCMLGFLSEDLDEAYVWYQVFQTAEATVTRGRGTAKASLTGLQFDVEVPDPAVSTVPWNWFTAGAAFSAPTALA